MGLSPHERRIRIPRSVTCVRGHTMNARRKALSCWGYEVSACQTCGKGSPFDPCRVCRAVGVSSEIQKATKVTQPSEMHRARVNACSLSFGYNTDGFCGWCGTPLRRNKDGSVSKVLRWCSLECMRAYSENHAWTDARRAAVRRDKFRCVRCGQPDRRAIDLMFRIITRFARGLGPGHFWSIEHYPGSGLEVNHITPVLGKHAVNGCHHHQDGLETLCGPCHQTETTRQARERALARRGQTAAAFYRQETPQ